MQHALSKTALLLTLIFGIPIGLVVGYIFVVGMIGNAAGIQGTDFAGTVIITQNLYGTGAIITRMIKSTNLLTSFGAGIILSLGITFILIGSTMSAKLNRKQTSNGYMDSRADDDVNENGYLINGDTEFDKLSVTCNHYIYNKKTKKWKFVEVKPAEMLRNGYFGTVDKVIDVGTLPEPAVFIHNVNVADEETMNTLKDTGILDADKKEEEEKKGKVFDFLKKKETHKLPASTLVVGTAIKGDDVYYFMESLSLHALIIGATGSGKTRGHMIQSMYLSILSGSSFIATDVKGEIQQTFLKMLEKHGYDIRLYNLMDVTTSNTFDAFESIKKDYELVLSGEKDYDSYLQTVASLQDIIIPPAERDEYWVPAAQNLFKYFTHLVVEYAPNGAKSLMSVANTIVETIMPAIRTIEKTKMTKKGPELIEVEEVYMPWAETHALIPRERNKTWRNYANLVLSTLKADNTYGGHSSTIQSKIDAFINRGVGGLLSSPSSASSMRGIGERKTAVFIRLKPGDSSNYRIASILLDTMLREFQRPKMVGGIRTQIGRASCRERV